MRAQTDDREDALANALGAAPRRARRARARDARRIRLGVALAVCTLGGLAACGPRGAPDVEAWRQRWVAARAEVPGPEAFAGPDADEVCGRVLAQLRAAREQLLPAPDAAVADAVSAWLEFGQALMLDCPIPRGPNAGFEAGLAELDRLGTEVDAALAYPRESPAS